jgi:Raf kinase inhibitor-like YbhB/YbcL family protein
MYARLLGACLALLPLGAEAAMTVSSPDVKSGGAIAATFVYTRCGGQNLSPALSWSGTPKNAKSLAVTVIDLSVKPADWSHWIVVNLPPATTSLARGAAALPTGASAVQSNIGDAQYDGPCPPEGSGVHRYEFKVWALKSAAPAIAGDERATDVIAKLNAVSLDSASLVATYQR